MLNVLDWMTFKRLAPSWLYPTLFRLEVPSDLCRTI